MPTAPYDERSSEHIKLVIMETSLIEWHGKWPGASREDRVITCHPDRIAVSLSKIQDSELTAPHINCVWNIFKN